MQPLRSASEKRKTELIGHSDAFASLRETIQAIGPRRSPVIITGATGTGKEMVARQIHAASPRAAMPFVPVDCTALGTQIVESQLFGHIKGAFTGAVSDSVGFFRAADGGTIFLDEIGEIPVDLQAKLLRVLQESVVAPVGTTRTIPIDVRVLCATNRDLKEMVRSESFRADLYFRLNVIQISVPPLCERPEDILVLAEHFLSKQAQLYDEPSKDLSESAREALLSYAWPGNVRELANAMEHAHVVCRDDTITTADLPMELLTHEPILPDADAPFTSFEQLQKRLVAQALEQSRGRKMKAARLLKIDHRKLARLVEQFGLEVTWSR